MATLGQGSSLIFRIDGDSSGFQREMRAVDASLGNIGSKFSSFAKDAALPAAAIASVAAIQARVAAEVVTGLFNLAKSASDAGSEIKDMQDKTGLAAVTLSTLKLAADSAGSSFEQVGGGIAKFAKLLGQAKDGNEAAQASLAALGVGTTDLDEALKQVIKSIANAAEGTDQITLAQKAFGKAGADLIPVIKQMNGNLEAAEKEAKKLGTTLSESDIKAADEFGDTLKVLSTQVSTLANRFALQFAPQITAALVEVINFLARNQSVAVEWGSVIADVLRGVMGVFSYAKTIVGGFLEAIGISFTASAGQARAWAQAILLAINPVLAILARIGQIIGANTPKEAQEGGGFAGVGGGDTTLAPGGGKGGGGGGASAKDTAEQQRQKAIQEQQAANGRALTAYKAFLDIQESELKQSLNLRLIDEVKYAKAIAEIKLKELLFEQTQNAKLLKDERLSDEERTDAENKKVILIRKVAKARIDIGNEVYQAIKKQTEQELKDLEKKLEDEEKIRQKARDKANAAADVDLQNKIKKRDARKERDPYNTGGPQEGANGDLDWQVPAGGDFLTGVVGALGAANEQLPIMQQLGQQLAATFGQVAQAVGAAVRSFVLFGTAGTSFRKFAAEVIASVAQMSIVQAVFELAQGFAMLALGWFTGNPKYHKSAIDHFTAAAVFGAIGGVAAGVGRGVAGNSFSNETGGGGSGGGSGGDAAGQPAPLQFTERFNGFEQRVGALIATATDRINEVTAAAGEQIQAFADKFGPVTPGHVVMAGAGDAGGAIFDAVNGHLSDDLRASSDFKRNSGDYN